MLLGAFIERGVGVLFHDGQMRKLRNVVAKVIRAKTISLVQCLKGGCRGLVLRGSKRQRDQQGQEQQEIVHGFVKVDLGS